MMLVANLLHYLLKYKNCANFLMIFVFCGAFIVCQFEGYGPDESCNVGERTPCQPLLSGFLSVAKTLARQSVLFSIYELERLKSDKCSVFILFPYLCSQQTQL